VEQTNQIYRQVVTALDTCADLVIPRLKQNFFRFWWSEELKTLKEQSIATSRIWKDAGKPRFGEIFLNYKRSKILYKRRIKEERNRETLEFTNDLHESPQAKSGPAFWKCWNAKFPKAKGNITQVDGISNPSAIASNFADHFEKVCTPDDLELNEQLMCKYKNLLIDYCGAPLTNDHEFDVQLISNLVTKLKRGKAAGLDRLSAEHLIFCHPSIVIILCKLFNMLIKLGHVPTDFGKSYTVPVPKGDSRCRSFSVNDFRGIAISPVISTLFEMAILDRFGDFFASSDYQYGF